MGGSGGRTFSPSRTPEDLARLVRQSEKSTSDQAFEGELAGLLGEFLGEINSRDTALVKSRLDEIRQLLESDVDDSFDLMFGGSVAKRTYVDGLSDIDSLLIINDTELAKDKPSLALDRMTEVLSDELEDAVRVEHGQMAVTVEYRDGMSIQLLPAVKTDGGIKVPSSRHDEWSEIEPRGFQNALSSVNAQCGGKLVPTIKLAKAILGGLPDQSRLTGYHVESLAIAAFKNYDGIRTTVEMLPLFFERAKDLVVSPIKDSTGQSVHVDTYLGVENSPARTNASHLLGRIAKRMRNATAAGSRDQWRSLFELDK